MGVSLSQASTPPTTGNNSNNGRGARTTGRKKYAVSDLPFAHWDIDSHKWHNQFVPSLLAWAGTQGDPFGTNSQMVGEVATLWQRLYPAIILNDTRRCIILSVVRTFSRPSWHLTSILLVREHAQ